MNDRVGNPVENIVGRLADKQTFLKLEGPGKPWIFGMRLAFGLKLYVEFRAGRA